MSAARDAVAEEARAWLATAFDDLQGELSGVSGADRTLALIEGVSRFAADVICCGSEQVLAREYVTDFLCQRVRDQVALAGLPRAS